MTGGAPVSRFFAEQPNPLTVVVGSVCVYHCVDIATVDRFLRDLSQRIKEAPALPKVLASYRADQDLLLDRRQWLLMTTGVS